MAVPAVAIVRFDSPPRKDLVDELARNVRRGAKSAVGEGIPLSEQLVVERACGAFWFQAELLPEQAAQSLVALADGAALAEAIVRFA
jgi:hypothetical protein